MEAKVCNLPPILLTPRYPRLMNLRDVSGGAIKIVLFYSTNQGFIIVNTIPGDPYNVGYHSKYWVMEKFEDFVGHVILSNHPIP